MMLFAFNGYLSVIYVTTTSTASFRSHRLSLTFDTMLMSDTSKYNGVRRLTNSDCLSRNPYFPSKYKIYWQNYLEWHEYNQVILVVVFVCCSAAQCPTSLAEDFLKLRLRLLNHSLITPAGSSHCRKCPRF